jgi:hypothetical protein
MNQLGVLLMMLLLLIVATPALTADPAALSDPSMAANTVAANDSMHRAVATTDAHAAQTPVVESQAPKSTATSARPVSKERSRRPARIDLTMPYYRFGRLPIRVKD